MHANKGFTNGLIALEPGTGASCMEAFRGDGEILKSSLCTLISKLDVTMHGWETASGRLSVGKTDYGIAPDDKLDMLVTSSFSNVHSELVNGLGTGIGFLNDNMTSGFTALGDKLDTCVKGLNDVMGSISAGMTTGLTTIDSRHAGMEDSLIAITSKLDALDGRVGTGADLHRKVSADYIADKPMTSHVITPAEEPRTYPGGRTKEEHDLALQRVRDEARAELRRLCTADGA